MACLFPLWLFFVACKNITNLKFVKLKTGGPEAWFSLNP